MVKKNKIPITSADVNIFELSALLYKIDLETMELGEEKERISGGEHFTYRFKEVEKAFFDKNLDEHVITREWGWYEVIEEEVEDEFEDIDPQF